MLTLDRSDRRLLAAKLAAIGRSQAIIEFAPDGTILTANQNFLQTMGYSLAEIQGAHHGMFVDPAERDSAEYRAFWASLKHGAYQARTFRRLAKGGREVWIQASYNPVLDRKGETVSIIKIATDITAQARESADHRGQIAAIAKSQAVIEFDLDGTILDANENFLKAMGYDLTEIQGRHHSIFVAPEERESAAYRRFWESLARGEFHAGEYCRFGKGGREVWIQATYNPIRDLAGRPFKVVKYASDVTEMKLRNADHASQIAAIGKSQAVIEFDLDGTIRWANDNFLQAVGYRLSEIQGRHHRMFVATGERDSAAYAAFWDRLRAGTFESGEYCRIGKDGREIWIQATYNPILDLNGRPIKVVKYATDVTEQVIARKRAQHVQQMMESVAAGSEQLNASVSEIASSMGKSKSTTTEAFNLVMGAHEATEKLAKATRAMGGIVDVINDITGQINLLALNASIESARAGAAGKGFAVVASEVKTLAGQARSATDQITGEIEGVQAVSGEVVGALDAIRHSMQTVLDYVTSTASAVEEQSSVANDMSQNMQQAAAQATRIGA